jgi:hypothetical protein
MPLDLRAKFSKTEEVTLMSMKSTNSSLQNLRSKVVLDKSLEQHSSMCVDNTKRYSKQIIIRELDEDIECRIKRYSKCLSQCSKIP